MNVNAPLTTDILTITIDLQAMDVVELGPLVSIGMVAIVQPLRFNVIIPMTSDDKVSIRHIVGVIAEFCEAGDTSRARSSSGTSFTEDFKIIVATVHLIWSSH